MFNHFHCLKSVPIWSYFGPHFCHIFPHLDWIRTAFFPHFPAFGLNTERYSIYLRIHSKCGKMRSRITPNMDTFYAVFFSQLWGCICLLSQLWILLFHSKITSKVLIKVNKKKKKWNSTSRFACRIKIPLKYFCKSEVYFQLNRTSFMEL